MDIKDIRIKLRLTQEELAHKLGVSWGTVARWEAGRSKPSKLAQRAIENLIRKKGENERYHS
jgi:DNA-binding transcriptional regulator YiaG